MINVRAVEDACDTGLFLGLGRSDSFPPPKLKCSSPNPKPFLEPSLSLFISSDDGYGTSAAAQSPNSTTNSSVNVKREINNDTESQQDDEEAGGSARKKLRLTKEQSALLEDKFKEHATLNPKQKQALAKQLNLRPRQVEVWFQNRRARTKLKQTEVDFEVLKRCCESLSDENKRLQKEVEELRAVKVGPTPPPAMSYMQPAAITVCPSCQRINATSTESTKARSFVVATASAQFLNPFARSAAC